MAAVPAQAAPAATGFAATHDADPFAWLEETESPRALEWVADHNRRSLGTLQGDSRYATYYQAVLERLQAADRIATPAFRRGGQIGNFWQDAAHVRGISRRTTVDGYLSGDPQWDTFIDVDALARSEHANWVYEGLNCLQPAEARCLMSLSDGGKDATVVREYDTSRRQFVEGGFSLPESKGGFGWISDDELFVYRDFGPGSMSTSGYPIVVKRLRRGQSLDQAVEVFRAQPDDVSAAGYALRDVEGRVRALVVQRTIRQYHVEYHVLTERGLKPFSLPRDNSLVGIMGDRLIFSTDVDWTAPSGQVFQAGDLLSVDLQRFIDDPAHARLELILRPGERDAVQGLSLTKTRLVVAMTENVRGAVYVFSPAADGWTRRKLALPENSTISLGSANDEDDRFFVNVTGYLTPPSLWLADAATGEARMVRQLQPKFNADGLVVEQFEAASSDGVRVPYFVVHRRDIPLDGSTPTILYGYGGFNNAQLPAYSSSVGKLWLENGGAWVVANIRGGGEFGPRWHQAALQANRHLAHDDFIAVGQDLIARRITSPRRLGIMGGSQGGLLMGTFLTQHPELINAAVIQVPLFDMLNYTHIGAGASWRSEYGDPDVPEQRAWIAAYSPYQNLRAGVTYPEVFIDTSTKDDRVHPSHGRKATARLEQLGQPVLYYENTDGGHAAGANLQETARRIALEYTYLTRRLMD